VASESFREAGGASDEVRLRAHLSGLGHAVWPHDEHTVSIEGADPVLPTRYRVGEAAAVALALGGVGAAELHRLRGAAPARVSVDVAHAAASLLGFALQARTDGASDSDLMRNAPATVALYETRDGRHIHLHGGFPKLHEGTLRLLGCRDDREAIARAVRAHDGAELESALADADLCGALVRSPAEWDAHPQAEALRASPAVAIERIGDAPAVALPPADRPLSGIRVLDLTRVLAGPTSGRTLAQYGADVLRIGAEKLPTIAPFVSETSHGKRFAWLDLDTDRGVDSLLALLREADVFTDGFRPGALEDRGLGSRDIATLRPGIIHVRISCYGFAGPFASRRGWEQLAQSVTGIASTEGGPSRGSPWVFNTTPILGRCARSQLVCPIPRTTSRPQRLSVCGVVVASAEATWFA
jgi:crotonobetainyl-CoA:carnitine CoA-transferase CaiB-like acyl-CoA transferase